MTKLNGDSESDEQSWFQGIFIVNNNSKIPQIPTIQD